MFLQLAKDSLKKKWQQLKPNKYQQINHQHQDEEVDNLSNEKLESRIIQILHLKSGIPANLDGLFALLDDGTIIPLRLHQ